jgi:lysophospholipase L1-like esterase
MRSFRTIRFVAVASILVGIGATALPAHAARSFLLRRTVVVGDSILAGFGNGGLVATGQMGQQNSAPAIIARRAHVKLPQPLMENPGVPAPYRIFDDNRNGVLDVGEVRRRSNGIGFRDDPDKDVRNLAVPGESVGTVFDKIDAQSFAGDLVGGNADGRDIMKFLILGLPLRDEEVSQITRARDSSPSFIMLWLGNNDVLDMATKTNPAGADMTPTEFGTAYRRLLNALADNGVPMVVANIPDVTEIAALRRAGQTVTQCQRADGTIDPVATDDLLSIDLDRNLLPTPPCNKVLNADERASIRATVVAFNAEIAAAISEVEVSRNIQIAPVDVFTTFDGYATDGVDVGGTVLTTDYLGGIFGLDGVHPTRTGNALIANAFIEAINARFGEAIPTVDVAKIARRDKLVNNRFKPPGEVPFGVIAEEDGSDLFTAAFDDIADGASDIGHDLAKDIGDFFDDLF